MLYHCIMCSGPLDGAGSGSQWRSVHGVISNPFFVESPLTHFILISLTIFDVLFSFLRQQSNNEEKHMKKEENSAAVPQDRDAAHNAHKPEEKQTRKKQELPSNV